MAVSVEVLVAVSATSVLSVSEQPIAVNASAELSANDNVVFMFVFPELMQKGN
jgi:hypothetical protein